MKKKKRQRKQAKLFFLRDQLRSHSLSLSLPLSDRNKLKREKRGGGGVLKTDPTVSSGVSYEKQRRNKSQNAARAE